MNANQDHRDPSASDVATGLNPQRLLWAGFMAILAAGVGFSIRAGILGQWAEQYGFTQTELGAITGGGLTGFGIIILLSSLIADRIGFGPLMFAAFAMHLVSAALTLATGAAYEAGPALRRPTPPHSAAHRPSRRAQDSRASRTAHRASTARTGSLTRTARLRLSRPPLTPPSTPLARSQRQRVGPLVPQAPAPRPERASDGSRARVPRRAPAPGGRLTDRRPATNRHLAVDDDRLRGSHPLGVPIRYSGAGLRMTRFAFVMGLDELSPVGGRAAGLCYGNVKDVVDWV